MRLILVGRLFCAGTADAGQKNRKKDAPATELQAAPTAPTTDPVVLPCNWTESAFV